MANPPLTHKERRDREQVDFELWKTWKADPTEENLIPLMNQIRPLIMSRVRDFHSAPVPEPAVVASASAHAMKALMTFKPTEGAQLKTWVGQYLQGVHSDVSKHQNIGRIPYRRSRQIGAYNQAVSELKEELGFDPDTESIARKMNSSLAEVGRLKASTRWTPQQVGKLQVDLGRADLVESLALEPDKIEDLRSGTEREVMRYIYQDLSPRERTVFEYEHGLYGKPQSNVTQTAGHVGLSAPTITRIRQGIQAKIDDRMKKRGM